MGVSPRGHPCEQACKLRVPLSTWPCMTPSNLVHALLESSLWCSDSFSLAPNLRPWTAVHSPSGYNTEQTSVGKWLIVSMFAPSSQLVNLDSGTSACCSPAHWNDLSDAWSFISRLVRPLHVQRPRWTVFLQLLFCGLSCMPIKHLIAHQPMHPFLLQTWFLKAL